MTSSISNAPIEIYYELHPKEIRLVKLFQGNSSDMTQCQLQHAYLGNRPSYNALSYAWGSPRATQPILVNGHQRAVTTNLKSALRRLRRTDSDLTVWIDALCINQSDSNERNTQVAIMYDIYSLANEVIVDLGEVPQHSFMVRNQPISTSIAAFHFDSSDAGKLEIFRSRFVDNKAAKVSKSKARMDYAHDIFCFLRLLAEETTPTTFPAFDSSFLEFSDTQYQCNLIEGLKQLLLSRWWNRIWVIQEVVVPKTVTVVYGSAVAPWDMFVDAARWISYSRSSPAALRFSREYWAVLAYFSGVILDIERLRELGRVGNQTTLLPLLRRFSGRKASDDRDKVYALLGLARNQTSIVPNYSLSTPAVFQASVLDIIRKTKSLCVLAGDIGRKDRQDLPSWVPDWSAVYDDLERRRADDMENYKATGSSLLYVQDEGDAEWRGLLQYLDTFDIKGIPPREKISKILGTSQWTDWIESYQDLKEEEYLQAVDSFYTVTGGAVCLRNLGDGIIELPGMHIDKIVVTGAIAFSEDVLLAVVHSWALLVHTHFLSRTYDRTIDGLGDAFRRMLCADIIRTGSDPEDYTTRRINNDDHGLIASWFSQKEDLKKMKDYDYQYAAWNKLFGDLGDVGTHT